MQIIMQSSGLNYLIIGNCGLRHTIWISWTLILIWSKIACLKHFKPFKALHLHQHEIKIHTVQKKKKQAQWKRTYLPTKIFTTAGEDELLWCVFCCLQLHNIIWDILFTLLYDSSDSLWRSQRSTCWHFDRGLQRGYCFLCGCSEGWMM